MLPCQYESKSLDDDVCLAAEERRALGTFEEDDDSEACVPEQ